MRKYIFQDYVNVRINTCICKMLYLKLGKDRSEKFIKGRNRKTSYESFEYIVSQNDVNISSTKVMRILRAEGKSFFTINEINSISQRFNIDKKYFEIGNDVTIIVPGLTEEDWKVYLNWNYPTTDAYKIPVSNSAKGENEIKDIIENAINDIIKTSKWKSLNTDDALYRILHLYTSGETFVGDDEETIVRNKLLSVEKLGYTDLIKMNCDEMVSHVEVLEQKIQLMKAIILVEKNK